MSVKLPKLPPDDGTRSEFEAFMTGFALAVVGIKRAFPHFDSTQLWKYAGEAATELYPPFDPLPNPVKSQGDGRRSDGIEMSED
jgi:hypothetical protein